MRGINPALAGSLVILGLGLILTSINIHKLSILQHEFIKLAHPGSLNSQCSEETRSSLRFTPYGKNLDSGYLKHVYAVLERLGYQRVSYNISSDWDVMWAHDYPFKKIKPLMKAMKKGQRVNKLPGTISISLCTLEPSLDRFILKSLSRIGVCNKQGELGHIWSKSHSPSLQNS